MLAHNGAETDPPHGHPLPAEATQLELLLRQREALERLLRKEKNRRQALGKRPGVPEAIGRSLERVIGALEQELAELEQALKRHIRQYGELGRLAKRLRTVSGVGAKNVLWMVVVLA